MTCSALILPLASLTGGLLSDLNPSERLAEQVDVIMRDCQSPSFTTRADARKAITELLEREKKLREALADLIQRQDRSIGQPSIRIEHWHRQALADSGEA